MYQLAFMVGASLLSSAGSSYGASQNVKMAKYQRDMLGYAGSYAQAQTKIDEAKLMRVRDQKLSAQKASTAASGIRTDFGAPLELRAETEIMADIDRNILRISGGIENLRYQTAQHVSMAQGYGQASAGYARGFGTLINTGSLLAARQWGTTTNNNNTVKLPYIPAK